MLNSVIVLLLLHKPTFQGRHTLKDDNDLNTNALCALCLRRHRINETDNNSRMFHEANSIVTERTSKKSRKLLLIF